MGAHASSERGQEWAQERVAHAARVRTVVMMLNTRLSGVALVQLEAATEARLVNLRLRCNPREGNDLNVVCNHGLVTDRLQRAGGRHEEGVVVVGGGWNPRAPGTPQGPGAEP
jgi:hypothetical protein